MKKILFFGGLAVLILAALAAYYISRSSESILSPKIVVPSKIAAPPEVSHMNLTRLPVQFSHVAMREVECKTCHHPVDGEEIYRKCSSKDCHDILGSNARREPRSYYRIMHEPNTTQYNSCMKCHLEVQANRPELQQTLTACAGSLCHP